MRLCMNPIQYEGCTGDTIAEGLGDIGLVGSTILLRLSQQPLVGAAEPNLHDDSASTRGQTEGHHTDEGADVARLLLGHEHERSSEVSYQSLLVMVQGLGSD